MFAHRTLSSAAVLRRSFCSRLGGVVSQKGEKTRRRALLRPGEDTAHWTAASLERMVGAERTVVEKEDQQSSSIYTWLLHYAANMSKVSGFFEAPLLQVYYEIFRAQKDCKVIGAVGEIGVFHGKSFLPLWAMRSANEQAVAIDLFDNQEENVDNSGCGSLKAVRKAMRRFPLPELLGQEETVGETFLVSENSSVLHPDTLLGYIHAQQRFRVFSVDGCHDAGAVEADLELVTAAMVPRHGIIILDDVFNPDWPGVVSGLASFLKERQQCSCTTCSARAGAPKESMDPAKECSSDVAECCSAWVPVMLGYNKCFLCLRQDHGTFSALFHARLSARGLGVRKTSSFMGSQVLILRQGWITAFHGNEEVAEMEKESE